MSAIAANKNNTFSPKAMGISIGVHLLLLLLFFLFRFGYNKPPEPLVGDGLEVNIGSSDDGSGNDQPLSKRKPGEYESTVQYQHQEAKSPLPQNLSSSDDPNAVGVSQSKNPTDANNPTNDPNQAKPENTPVPKNVYNGTPGEGGNGANAERNGSNEGNGHGPGDKGVEGGTDGAPNYTGTPGVGGNIGHNLAGRDIYPKKFEAEFHEGGTVVIRVTVNKDGSIASSYIKSASNPELTKIAQEKLKTVHFSKSMGNDPQQFGDITIVFKTR